MSSLNNSQIANAEEVREFVIRPADAGFGEWVCDSIGEEPSDTMDALSSLAAEGFEFIDDALASARDNHPTHQDAPGAPNILEGADIRGRIRNLPSGAEIFARFNYNAGEFGAWQYRGLVAA